MSRIAQIRTELKRMANPAVASTAKRFFKSGPGEYGEGDKFRGIKVPVLRTMVKGFPGVSIRDAASLLASPWHEDRLLALFFLIRLYKKGTASQRNGIHRLYLSQAGRGVNNWDLVDSSAEHLVGAHLWGKNEFLLLRLAASPNLWKRRVAMLATFFAIKRGNFRMALSLAREFQKDEHDLMHKAVGWMLREIGKRNLKVETDFLNRHAGAMPRTMLRYAVEKFPPRLRQRYMKMKNRPR